MIHSPLPVDECRRRLATWRHGIGTGHEVRSIWTPSWPHGPINGVTTTPDGDGTRVEITSGEAFIRALVVAPVMAIVFTPPLLGGFSYRAWQNGAENWYFGLAGVIFSWVFAAVAFVAISAFARLQEAGNLRWAVTAIGRRLDVTDHPPVTSF